MATAESDERMSAPESSKTKKVREKILKQWESEKSQITPKALKDTVEKIYKWIADNSKNRLPIEKKGIRLFNQNKDAATLSKKVRLFADSLIQKDPFS